MFKTKLLRHIQLLMNQSVSVNQKQDQDTQSEMSEFSRRDFFLEKIPLAAMSSFALVNLSGCSTSSWNKEPLNSENKVVILGAGLAGLTAAYYLRKAGIPCEIYESSDRIGGRVFTFNNFNEDKMSVEFGGEFIDSNHADILRLCQDLGVKLDDYRVGQKNILENIYYFKGKKYTDRDFLKNIKALVKIFKADFNKAFPPQSKNADDFTDYAKKLDQTSLTQYLESHKNVTEAWVIDLLKIAYVGEMGISADEISALVLISTLSLSKNKVNLYGDSDQALHIRGGNQVLIDKLVEYLTSQSVRIHLGSTCVEINELSDQMRLYIERKGQAPLVVTTKKVICTIPFNILNEIDGVSKLNLSPEKKEYLAKMTYASHTKGFLNYKSKPWRDQGFVISGKQKLKSTASVYTDLAFQNSWDSSYLQKGKSGVITTFTGGEHQAKQITYSALKGIRADLNLIFNGINQYDTDQQMLCPWIKKSYSTMKIGEMTRYLGIARRTELSGKLLFAGEHANEEFIGFMNGACLSGRLAASEVIKF